MSEEAIIIEAQTPTNESAPYLPRSPSKVANDALPENGLNKIKGKSSLGIFKKSSTKERYFVIKGSTPEPKNIETETISAHIVGNIENELFMPHLAPLKKLAK